MTTATIDVSLVLALHREAPLLQRTLLSLREAAQYARAEGIGIELVATLDRADALTRQVLREFKFGGFDGLTVLEVDHGSLGLSRNAGIKASRGRFICTCDGDDLISYNSIAAMFRLADTAGPGHLVFHQYLCVFGERFHCCKRLPLEMITPLEFLEQHPYSSAAFGHRAIFEAVAYTDSRIASGYAYEDWHFNAECVARGYQILVAEDTIYFYRQHCGSLLDQANKQTTRQIQPCTLFKPQVWVRVTRDAYERLGALDGARPHELDSASGSYVLGCAPHLAFIRAANAIDPELDPLILRESTFSTNLEGTDLTAARAYHEICQVIGARCFDEVFLLSSLPNDTTEQYFRDIIHFLYDMRPTARILILLSAPLAASIVLNLAPPNATVIDLGNEWPQLTAEQCEHIVLKLIQSTAHQARLHLQQAPFPERFYRRFKTVLRLNPSVYYRLGDFAEVGHAGSIRTRGFKFVAEHAQDLTAIVVNNEATIADDRKRIAICPEKWRWLPARHSPNLTEAKVLACAARRKGHVLWSLPDSEKRANQLLRVAAELNRLGSDIRIDVFGRVDSDISRFSRLDGLHNLSYRGACQGQAMLSHSAYDVLVYSPAIDEMSEVIEEALANCVPVIAPDIGEIGKIIVDGDNGLLLHARTNDNEMAAAYTAAIMRLTNDPALRAKLAAGALRRAVGRHCPAAFDGVARAIFGDCEIGATEDSPHSTPDFACSFNEDHHDDPALPQKGYSMEQSDKTMPREPLQRFKEHVAFLEEQISELQRASIVEKTRLSTRSLANRVALLEQQIVELGRASLKEKEKANQVRAEANQIRAEANQVGVEANQVRARLREIESSRGYKLLQQYYALVRAPIVGPVIQLFRRVVGINSASGQAFRT
jgi:glycosyltransferase involved in cell wall biosynthesis